MGSPREFCFKEAYGVTREFDQDLNYIHKLLKEHYGVSHEGDSTTGSSRNNDTDSFSHEINGQKLQTFSDCVEQRF